jgi:hypothetical protein
VPRKLATAAMISVVAALLSFGAGAQASPDQTTLALPYQAQLVNYRSYLCTLAHGTDPHAGDWAIQVSCSTLPTPSYGERWTFVPMTTGYVNIVSARSGMCLDVFNGTTDNGATVISWPCRTTDNLNQQWQVVGSTDTYFKVVNRKSGRCLDVFNGSIQQQERLIQWDCRGRDDASQWWSTTEHTGAA